MVETPASKQTSVKSNSGTQLSCTLGLHVELTTIRSVVESCLRVTIVLSCTQFVSGCMESHNRTQDCIRLVVESSLSCTEINTKWRLQLRPVSNMFVLLYSSFDVFTKGGRGHVAETYLLEAREHEGITGFHRHLHVLDQPRPVLDVVPHWHRLPHPSKRRQLCNHQTQGTIVMYIWMGQKNWKTDIFNIYF